MMTHNVVDSSAWIEYFIDGPNAAFFAPAIEDVGRLLVPSISLCEVFRATLQHQTEGEALKAVAQMKQGHVCELNEDLALRAAKLQHELGLPLANSIMLATAQVHRARLWTQDAGFRRVPDVQFREAATLLTATA